MSRAGEEVSSPALSHFSAGVTALIHVFAAPALLLVLLRPFGDQRVTGQQQRRDAGRVLQGEAHHLGRVDVKTSCVLLCRKPLD